MAVDWSRPIEARNGREARVIGKLDRAGQCRVVAVKNKSGVESVYTFYENGSWDAGGAPCELDIVNRPLRVDIGKRWAPVFRRDDGSVFFSSTHDTYEDAVRYVSEKREEGCTCEHLGTWELPSQISIFDAKQG